MEPLDHGAVSCAGELKETTGERARDAKRVGHFGGVEPKHPARRNCGAEWTNGTGRMKAAGFVAVLGGLPDPVHDLPAGHDGCDEVATAQATLLGVVGSQPAIAVSTPSSYAVTVGGTTVFNGPPAPSNPSAPIVVDGATVWFSSQANAVWRWPGSGRAARAATVPLSGLQVAGGCR